MLRMSMLHRGTRPTWAMSLALQRTRAVLGYTAMRRWSTTTASDAGQGEGWDQLAVERKWKERWRNTNKTTFDGVYGRQANTCKGKYVLAMFPYPSGRLHMGHVRVYSISDCIARYEAMQQRASGDDSCVLHPMGWDSFGLPAENAARIHGVPPDQWTVQNISHMRAQLDALSCNFEWCERNVGQEAQGESTANASATGESATKEIDGVSTANASYYRWTQQLFLMLHEEGLAQRVRSSVNWDPVDCTVLANEQVGADGTSWRSGAMVEQREMNQWVLKITKFAKSLLEGLDELEGRWPAQVLSMQRNWIGASEGVKIQFPLRGEGGCSGDDREQSGAESISVFTTKPETLYGVSFVGIAPSHPLLSSSSVRSKLSPVDVDAIEQVRARQTATSRVHGEHGVAGHKLPFSVVHPLTGQELPVYVCEYVLSDYGEGAVMAVPAHDERDRAFALAHDLPEPVPVVNDAEDESPRLINSGEYSGMNIDEATKAIGEELGKKRLGQSIVSYRLRDWLISRQRYWGAPIPVVYCKACAGEGEEEAIVPVPREELPVVLPSVGADTTEGVPALSEMKEWLKCRCPKCGGEARRESDTMDTFVDSSWYFLRFTDPFNSSMPFSVEAAARWMPVDLYVGGIEHAILHLLYSRFFTHFLHSKGLVPSREPFKELLAQGMVHGATYRHPHTRHPLQPSEISLVDGKRVVSGTDLEPTLTHEKMSKSKFNGVDPVEIVEQYGVDATRLFMLFKAPPEKVLLWETDGIVGQTRWLRRVASLVSSCSAQMDHSKVLDLNDIELGSPAAALHSATLSAIRRATEACSTTRAFNTAIAALMELSNSLSEYSGSPGCAVYSAGLGTLVRMMAPFAPHAAAEYWERLGGSGSVHAQRWPAIDEGEEEWLQRAEAEAKREDSERLQAMALELEPVRRHVGDAEIARVVLAKQNTMVNIVFAKPKKAVGSRQHEDNATH